MLRAMEGEETTSNARRPGLRTWGGGAALVVFLVVFLWLSLR